MLIKHFLCRTAVSTLQTTHCRHISWGSWCSSKPIRVYPLSITGIIGPYVSFPGKQNRDENPLPLRSSFELRNETDKLKKNIDLIGNVDNSNEADL